MDFQKIKHNATENNVTLVWEQWDSGQLSKHTLESKDPHPDFTRALDDLRESVLEALDFEHQIDPLDVVVRGVTLKATTTGDGDLAQGCTITALLTLRWANAPLVINTPFSPVEVMPCQSIERKLDRLCEEAGEYVRGKRSQGDLFVGVDGAIASAEVES